MEPDSGPFFRACAEGRELAAALDLNQMAADVTHLLSSLAPASATAEVARDFYPGWAVSSPTARERKAFRRAFYNADEIGKDSAIGRRNSTVRLIQEFVESAAVPVSQTQIREGLFHGSVNGSQMSWKNPNLTTGRSRWQVLQIRQLQRIGIEALLSWFEFRLQAHLDRDTDAIAQQAAMELASASDIFPVHQTVGECLESSADEAKDLDEFLSLARSSDLWNPPTMVQALRNIVESHPPEMIAHSLRALFILRKVH